MSKIYKSGNSKPEKHELKIAQILVKYFKTDITFIPPINQYKTHTPDIIMFSKYWELKSPKGKNKSTIQRTLKEAKKQSKNIIIDSSRTKLTDTFVLNQLQQQLKFNLDIKQLYFIDKLKNIKVLKGKKHF